MSQPDIDPQNGAIRFFAGAKSKPNETLDKLRNGAERVAYIIATGGIPEDQNVNEAIANFAAGVSEASGKSQQHCERQIRKYLKERSWEPGREP